MVFFQKNPVTMVGNIEDCWLFTYQSPKEVIQNLLPPPFEVVSKEGFAFWNIVICRLSQMRPKGVPLGINYFHVAYRTMAKFETKEGKEIEGLYFFRSDCQPKWMAPLGNIVTKFNFHPAEIGIEKDPRQVRFEVRAHEGGNANGILHRGRTPVLPMNAPFQTLEEAKEFLKYKPVGFFSLDEGTKVNAVFIERNEKDWEYEPILAEGIEFEFLKPYRNEFLMAFEVKPIRYQWNRGVIIDV